jgi:predicted GIY-YIG superfamily endonuclease
MDAELLKLQKGKWACYLLRRRDGSSQATYNGSTNDLFRRLRQHNGEITGGAKATSKFQGGWEIYCFMTGFCDHVNALQAEWRWKHPDNSRKRPAKYSGVKGRIRGLNEVIGLAQWTNNSTIQNDMCQYELYVTEDVYDCLDKIPENVNVVKITHT